MTIEQKRRELFEAHYADINLERNEYLTEFYTNLPTRMCWEAWNAALDAVVIELPEPEMYFFDGGCHWAEDEYLGQPDIDRADPYGRIDKVRAAIESTGLGLKVKP